MVLERFPHFESLYERYTHVRVRVRAFVLAGSGRTTVYNNGYYDTVTMLCDSEPNSRFLFLKIESY